MDTLVSAFLDECQKHKAALVDLAAKRLHLIQDTHGASDIDIRAWADLRQAFTQHIRLIQRIGYDELCRAGGRKRTVCSNQEQWQHVCDSAILMMNGINSGLAPDAVTAAADGIILELIEQIKKIKYKEMEY